MIGASELEVNLPPATAGDIAVINLRSARQQSWCRFWDAPQQPGIAEYTVEQEQLAVQFLGDFGGLDRLETLSNQLARVDNESSRTALISAQVASITHRFADARNHLAQAEVRGAPQDTTDRLSLTIDQACGINLDAVLDARYRMAAESGRLEDLVPLAALLADLHEFDEAESIYHRALREYQDVSPFAVAWLCFQLGVLWGELVAEPQAIRAVQWYRRAIGYLPCYVRARVHLAEIYSGCGQTEDAEALLIPALSTGEPEVRWRLADVLHACGRIEDAAAHIQAARSGFEVLLDKHLLAFADHGAEFFSGSGNDARRAFELAKVNVANRPTLRAFEKAYEAAVAVGESDAAYEILAAARNRWAGTLAYTQSFLVMCENGRKQRGEST